jgi:hypothetical protein
MESYASRSPGNDGGTQQLQDVIDPVRDRIENAARKLGRALARATESVQRIRTEDVRLVMKRAPMMALGLAMGVGFAIGLALWARGR